MGEQRGEGDVTSQGSILVAHRKDRSLAMLIAQHSFKPFKSSLVKLAKPMPPGSPQLEIKKSIKKRCQVSERNIHDVHIYDVKARHDSLPPNSRGESVAKKRIYYFAGGGWRSPPTSEHWKVVGEMACRLTNTVVSLISYPLAPNSPASVTFPELMMLYRTILHEGEVAGEEVSLVGDSAGGNIILSLTLCALQEDPESPCPRNLVAIAPSTDLTRANPDIQRLEKHDPLLRVTFIQETAASWCGEWSPEDPRVSPLFADPKTFGVLAARGVRIHGITGGYDILSPDGVLFRDKCKSAGIQGEWLHWDKQMHCFFLAFSFKLRESVEAMEWIIDVLQRH